MYAIVEIAGQQFKVEKNQELYVHRLEGNEGAKVEFDRVLLIDNGGKVTVGAPSISGAKVGAKIISHVKGEKVLVFKKKRRKGYQKLNGHRQQFTKIQIEKISGKGEAKAKAKAKEETEAKKEVKAEAKKEVKKETKKEAKTEKKSKD